jgi:hypothetical protein
MRYIKQKQCRTPVGLTGPSTPSVLRAAGDAHHRAFRLRKQVNHYKKIQLQPVDNF